MGSKSKAQKNYRNRKDALLEGCVEEVQERILVGFIQRGGRLIMTADTILAPWLFFFWATYWCYFVHGENAAAK